MNSYILSEEYRFNCASTTKGTQEKYFKDGYYFKLNKNGNEGFVEYLVSEVLKHSTIEKELIVEYEYCNVNGKLACKSANFLKKNEDFLTVNTLYMKVTGYKNLDSKLARLGNARSRLDFILGIAERCRINREMFSNYMKRLMFIDLLIRNTDRHIHNYGCIYNYDTGIFREAPVFDNGLSLNTDGNEGAASTISGSFEDQVVATGYPVKSPIKFNYEEVYLALAKIKDLYGENKEIGVLEERLKKYKRIFS
jgi:hypothetical protein